LTDHYQSTSLNALRLTPLPAPEVNLFDCFARGAIGLFRKVLSNDVPELKGEIDGFELLKS